MHRGRSLKSCKSIWYTNFRNLSPSLIFFFRISLLFHPFSLLLPVISHCLPFYCFTTVSVRIAQTRLYRRMAMNQQFYVRNHFNASSVHVQKHTSIYTFRRCGSMYMSYTIMCRNCSRLSANCLSLAVTMSCLSVKETCNSLSKMGRRMDEWTEWEHFIHKNQWKLANS